MASAAVLLLDDDHAPHIPDGTLFDVNRQLGELASVTASTAGSTYLAKAYTGWPSASVAGL